MSAARWIVVTALILSLSSPAAARPEEVDSTATIDTVEVTARREAMRKAIVTFVGNITRRDGEYVGRWREPVCPSVAGATPEQGEFISLRIREVAALAGAPVSRQKKCEPNLIVILTDQPDKLWTAWRARYPKMFIEESQPDVKRAVETARPVSTWQNAVLENADGGPRSTAYRLKDSHILSSVSENIRSVIVVVNTSATGGATFGQLADYVAMVGLARIDLDADFASSATILRLFAKSGSEPAPSRLTSWDESFLKGLYGTRDALLRPRSDIVRSMSGELSP